MFSQTLLCLNRILPRPSTNPTFILSFIHSFNQFRVISFHFMSCHVSSCHSFISFCFIPFHSLHFMSFHAFINSLFSFIHSWPRTSTIQKPNHAFSGYLWNKNLEPRVSNGTSVFDYIWLILMGSISRLIYQSPIPMDPTVGGRNPAPLYLHPKTNPRTPSLTLGHCLVVRTKEVE